MHFKCFYESNISDEEKIMLQVLTFSETDENSYTDVGLYFTKNYKNIKIYQKSRYSDVCLSRCSIKIFISLNEIQQILQCLPLLINFLTLKCLENGNYGMFVKKLDANIFQLCVVCSIYNEYKELKNGIENLVYFIDIINNDIKNIFVQFASTKKGEHDRELNLSLDSEHYNLIDQYNSYIKHCKDKKMLSSETSLLEKIILGDKVITVTSNSYQGDIKFVNCINLNDIKNYLVRQFGLGELVYEVDISNGKEKIKYIVADTLI